VTFRMMAGGSGKLDSPQWSSRSGDGSANGILYNIGATLRKSVEQRSDHCATRQELEDHGEGHISSSVSPNNLLTL
jgi:hypothetical protein